MSAVFWVNEPRSGDNFLTQIYISGIKMSDDCKNVDLMEKIVSLCKRRGFVFPSSEIYGGINGFWDYGPYGSRMKKAIELLNHRSLTMDQIAEAVGYKNQFYFTKRFKKYYGVPPSKYKQKISVDLG